jgi:tetratricopeptide (TPR) repeat protein
MTDQGRIMLLYRRARCGAHPDRLLAALDDRYREREVIDFALDGAAPALESVARRVRADDVVLVLADPEWDVSDHEAGLGDEETIFGPAFTLWVSVDYAIEGARVAMSELTWEADVQRLLGELDVHIGEPFTSDYRVGVVGEDVEQLFDDAAQLQESGLHQDAIDMFQTIIRSRDPGFAGRAAYAAGRSYEKLQDSNHAVQSYREAITLGPRDASAAAAYGLGRLLYRRGEFEEAAAAFGEAAELGDDSMRARAEQLRDSGLRKAGLA